MCTGKLLLSTSLATALILTAGMQGAAKAADTSSGFYGKAFGGLVIPEETDSEFPDLLPPIDVKTDGELGFRFGGAIGYRLKQGVRFEAEASYQKAGVDDTTFTRAGVSASSDVNGDTSVFSLMGNILYDLPVDFVVTPYVGGGVGWAHVSVNDVSAPSISPAVQNGDDGTIAYQIIGGIQRQVGKVYLGLQYRYFRVGEFSSRDNFGSKNVTDHAASHNIEVQVTVPFSVFE